MRQQSKSEKEIAPVAKKRSPMASIIVSLPGALRAKVGNRAYVTVTGGTVREIIDALEREFPGLRFNLCYETGELRPYVNVFLDRANIRYLQGLDTPVSAGTSMRILQAVAGG
jgi:sulfur-carrier protein